MGDPKLREKIVNLNRELESKYGAQAVEVTLKEIVQMCEENPIRLSQMATDTGLPDIARKTAALAYMESINEGLSDATDRFISADGPRPEAIPASRK